ncbi:C2 domain containing protein 3, partial [Dissostichus eleginoides]
VSVERGTGGDVAEERVTEGGWAGQAYMLAAATGMQSMTRSNPPPIMLVYTPAQAANLDFLLQCAHGAKPIQPRRLGKVGKSSTSTPLPPHLLPPPLSVIPGLSISARGTVGKLCVSALPNNYLQLRLTAVWPTAALGLWTRRSSSEQDSCVWDHTSPLQRGLTTAQKQPKDRPSNPPHLPACVPRKPLQGSPSRIQTWASPLPFVPLAFKAGQEPLLLSARSQPRASPCHLALGSARCS